MRQDKISKTIFATTLSGMPIELATVGRTFTVTYWKQIDRGLTYEQATQKLGQAIMHALACGGLIENS